MRRRIFRFADERFDFGHDRIREVALAEILPPRRRILHRQVAAALDVLGDGRRDRDWGALASHCREAGLWARAAEAFREAGRTASVRSAEREAAACFEAALAALGQAPESRSVLESIVDGRALGLDGAGWELFKARALASLGHAHLVAGRSDDAERRGHDALALARRRGERGAEGWALWLLAETAARQEPAALDCASARYAEALELAAQLGLRPLEAYCHCGLGQLLPRARHPEAETHVRRADALAREMEITLWLWPGETLAPGAATPELDPTP